MNRVVDRPIVVPELVSAMLHVAIDPPGRAASTWQRIQARVDLDQCWDEHLLGLLPMVARNLEGVDADPPEMARLRGVRRRIWYIGQRVTAAATELVAVLEGAGVRAEVVAGSARAVAVHDDIGARSAADTSLVIAPDALTTAARALAAAGWVVTPPPRQGRGGLVTTRWIDAGTPDAEPAHAATGSHRWTLHTAPNPWLAAPAEWRTRRIQLAGHDVTTLDPTDDLVVVILGGPRSAICSGVGWIPDAVGLLRTGQVDAARVLEIADRHGVAPLLVEPLRYLDVEFDVSVDPDLTRTLASMRVSRRSVAVMERWARPSQMPASRHRRWRSEWEVATHHRSSYGAIAALPAFLTERAGAASPIGVPGALRRRWTS